MTYNSLSVDTQAILLLTSRLGQPEQGVTPFRPAEFIELVKTLKSLELEVGDLLDPGNLERISEIPEAERMSELLARGLALAVALDKWEAQGIWVIGWNDEKYPASYRENLRGQAPPVMYGIGDASLLSTKGIGIVGSRDVDEPGLEFTRTVAKSCARHHIQVISGGARGVDGEAMLACIEFGGSAVGIMADSLARHAVSGRFREAIRSESLVLVSPFEPEARFLIGNAMARNKLIYALSEFALVISSDYNTGGTWAGATENLRKSWAPLFVRDGEGVPEGNRRLVKMGVVPVEESADEDVVEWMQGNIPEMPQADASVGVRGKREKSEDTLSLF